MVKSSGGRWKGSGSGSAPSSPTRRRKKGGKRGRRLCHMEGCTLCPSFGFEGDVAVSCSHHKEDGMRNLTARRCQHNGCFTVANFGFPGDKPGYCAAHSTEGMVNRNKPRGSEGMLSGMTVSRSSRRATKASIASSYATGGSESAAASGAPTAAAAGAAAAVATTEGSGGLARNQASSGGKEVLTRTAVSGDVGLGRHRAFGNGAETDAAVAPAVAGRARASGSRRRGSYRDNTSSDGDEKAELAKSFFGGGNHSNVTGGGSFKSAKAQAQEAAAAPVPPPPVAFIARGDGVEAANARSHAARAGGGGGGGGGGRRPRGDSKGLGSATITAGVLQHQEASMPVSRGKGMLPVVETAGGGGGSGRVAVDVSFCGDTRMDGSFLMDGGSFGETSFGAGGASLGAGVDTGRAELRSILLGDAGDTPEVRDSVADGGFSFAVPSSSARVARPSPGVQSIHEASRPAGGLRFGRDSAASGGGEHAGARSSFESGGSLASGGGTAPAPAPAAGVFVDFGLDHLPELSSNDFAGLRGMETGVGANHLPRVTIQQHQQRTASRGSYDLAGAAAPAPAAEFFSSCEGVRLGSDSSASAAAAVLAASSVVSDDVPSEAFSSPDASSVSFAAEPPRAAAAAAESRPPSSNGGDALMATAAATRMMMPGEEAWWEVLEGEEFVAMPEPTWGGVGGLDTQSMMEESLRANPRGCGWRSNGGGGGGGSGRGGVETNRGVAESGRSPHGDGGRTVTSHAATTRSLSLDSSSIAAATAAAGLGGVLVMPGDEGFSGDMSGRDSCGRNGVVHGISGGGSGGRLCPSSKKFAASVGDARVAFSTSPFMPDAPPAASRAMKPSSRELGSASTTSTSPSGSVFSPAASSSPNGVYPTGFGLAVHSQVPLPHGGAGLRSAGQGSAHENGGLSKAWVPGDMWATTATTTTSGDAMSPSKCLSLSPAKAVTVMAASPSSSSPALSMLAQSTPPWGAGPLCSPQQTRAASRA
ncbi:unnamed protein product [Ectocarpus sp. CCAP 1310/34]|nr:unnamed protein product [Ectocarpus sp. CCAP 1310/34]